jgi:hypothetical protein
MSALAPKADMGQRDVPIKKRNYRGAGPGQKYKAVQSHWVKVFALSLRLYPALSRASSVISNISKFCSFCSWIASFIKFDPAEYLGDYLVNVALKVRCLTFKATNVRFGH